MTEIVSRYGAYRFAAKHVPTNRYVLQPELESGGIADWELGPNDHPEREPKRWNRRWLAEKNLTDFAAAHGLPRDEFEVVEIRTSVRRGNA